jgi:hypothetical protein
MKINPEKWPAWAQAAGLIVLAAVTVASVVYGVLRELRIWGIL